jgi:hypothetical protein
MRRRRSKPSIVLRQRIGGRTPRSVGELLAIRKFHTQHLLEAEQQLGVVTQRLAVVDNAPCQSLMERPIFLAQSSDLLA